MNLQWFLSGTVRHANAMCKHVRKILNHQRDILSPGAIKEVEAAIAETRLTITNKVGKAVMTAQMEKLESAANSWLKPYPNASYRENLEVLLVALTVAMGVRTFFVQPFKIPTGSMQPTLFGVTSENLDSDFRIPTGLQRIKEWFQGTSYLHLVADRDGEFQGAGKPFPPAIFSIYQRVHFANETYTVWFPPDYGSMSLHSRETPESSRSNVQIGQFFKKGQDIIKLKVTAGDHLFVDRVSFNFRAPERGDIIVFETHGISAMTDLMPRQGDTFYIKRLVGLGGETLSINKNYDILGVPRAAFPVPVGNLIVDGKPLSASSPHFENLYSFSGATGRTNVLAYEENHYYGHAMLGYLSPEKEYQVATNSLFVMGDNTMNSLDSRYWGDFPQSKVIGKSFFVYWPITDRFGCSTR
jgi:signal peptidase I